MNLHILSRLPDDLGGPLGPPIRPAPTHEIAEVRRRVGNGTLIERDGKMSFEPDEEPTSNVAVNPGFPHTPAPTPPPAPETAATDEACGLKAGDVPEGATHQNVLHGGYYMAGPDGIALVCWTDGRPNGRAWRPSCFSNEELNTVCVIFHLLERA